MSKFLICLIRFVNLYLYFVVGACLLSLVPNINPNYPLFHFIFKCAGFYVVPPVFGVSFSPMLVMIGLVLVSMGLYKIYDKFYSSKEPKIIVMSPEEFIKKVAQKELQNDMKDDINSSNKEDKNL